MAALVVVSTLVALAAGAGPAAGHTDLLQGSPGPGQQVGGTVDFVDLAFVGPVTDVRIVVTDPDGRPVPGQMVVADGQIVRFTMEPLTVPGRHVLEYDMISEDGDPTEGSYFFSYTPEATQPFPLSRVNLPDPPSETGETVRTVALVVAVVALLGLCVVLLVTLRRRQAALAAQRASSRS